MDSARHRENIMRSLCEFLLKIILMVAFFPLPVTADAWRVPEEKAELFKWLTDQDQIKRSLAANLIWEKYPEDRERLHGLLNSMLRSPSKNKRVSSALFMRKHYPQSKKKLLKVMEEDPETDVRIRVSQRYLADHNETRAKLVLREIVAQADIHRCEDAEFAMRAAKGLQEGAGEVVGIEQAQAILTAPPTWFKDLSNSSEEHSRRGTVKAMAASFLLKNREAVPKARLETGLRTHIVEVKERLRSSKDKKASEYWEGHLTSMLDMAVGGEMKNLVIEHADSANLIKNKRTKKRLFSIIKKAEANKK